MITRTYLILLCLVSYLSSSGQKTDIRLNQIGFYPQGPKMAIIVGSKGDKFMVMDTKLKDTLYKGTLKDGGVWKYSEEKTKKADFTDFTKVGTYVLYVPGTGKSYPFEIRERVHRESAKAGMKAFYYNRASMELLPKYAGKFARKEGHPDTAVLVHPSAATSQRPAGTKIPSPRGWYDAGDYNKYIVNSGISTYTLLAAYENYPAFLDTLTWNIPESRNQLPDILDESLWNIRWMLTMQDLDGGVYSKLTNPNFDAMVMPAEATAPRYVIKKSTAAALDFAGVMAVSARIFSRFSKQLPGFSDSCLKAARSAYAWAKKNPDILYNQNEMNEQYDPDVVTGEYGDRNVSDEFQWAATELFVTTQDKTYLDDANIGGNLSNGFGVPGWSNVNTLGLYSLVINKDKVASAAGDVMGMAEQKILSMADGLQGYAASSPYSAPMGANEGDFVWGSNSVAANQGMLLLIAYRISKKPEYLNAAIANLDYLMGRNATGYCFLTGFGDKPTMNPHHRPSVADGIVEPIPGFLSGGPNPGQQDKSNCTETYPSDLPAKSFLDNSCSYASNEIAINWNAPFAYLALGVEALKETGKPSGQGATPQGKGQKKKK